MCLSSVSTIIMNRLSIEHYHSLSDAVTVAYRSGGLPDVIRYLAGSGKFFTVSPVDRMSGTRDTHQQAYQCGGLDSLFADILGVNPSSVRRH
jgi:hypothetical protein